jgi:hypothetical protein
VYADEPEEDKPMLTRKATGPRRRKNT